MSSTRLCPYCHHPGVFAVYQFAQNSLALYPPCVCKSAYRSEQSCCPSLLAPWGPWFGPVGSRHRSQALDTLFIQGLKPHGKFKVSKEEGPARSKRWWFFDSAPGFLNIMFLNKVNGYSREIAQGRSWSRATTGDLINQINNEASTGKQRACSRPSCLFVFPLRSCSYKQWAHSKGLFKNPWRKLLSPELKKLPTPLMASEH